MTYLKLSEKMNYTKFYQDLSLKNNRCELVWFEDLYT